MVVHVKSLQIFNLYIVPYRICSQLNQICKTRIVPYHCTELQKGELYNFLAILLVFFINTNTCTCTLVVSVTASNVCARFSWAHYCTLQETCEMYSIFFKNPPFCKYATPYPLFKTCIQAKTLNFDCESPYLWNKWLSLWVCEL